MAMYINPSNSHTLNTLSLNAGFWTAVSSSINNSTSLDYYINSKVFSFADVESNTSTAYTFNKYIHTDVESIERTSVLNIFGVRKRLGSSSILGDTESLVYLSRATVAPVFIFTNSTSDLSCEGSRLRIINTDIDNTTNTSYKVNRLSYNDVSSIDYGSVVNAEGTRGKTFYVDMSASTSSRLTIQMPYYVRVSISDTSTVDSSSITAKNTNISIQNDTNSSISSYRKRYSKSSIIGDTESVTYLVRAIVAPTFIIQNTISDLNVKTIKSKLVTTNIPYSNTLTIKPNKSIYSNSNINNKSFISFKPNKSIYRCSIILGDTESLAYHPYRANYTSIVPITINSNINYSSNKSRLFTSKINTTSTIPSIKSIKQKITNISNISAFTEAYSSNVVAVTSSISDINGKSVFNVTIIRGKISNIPSLSVTSDLRVVVQMAQALYVHVPSKTSVEYRVTRNKFVEKLDIIPSVFVMCKEAFVYNNGYLKMDLCKHKPEEEKLTAFDLSSVFYL